MEKIPGRGFRIYVGVMLFLITLLLAALVAGLAYGASQLRATSSDQLDTLSHKADSINKSLDQLNQTLQQQNAKLPAGYP